MNELACPFCFTVHDYLTEPCEFMQRRNLGSPFDPKEDEEYHDARQD